MPEEGSKPRTRGAPINNRHVHKMRDPIVNPCIPEADASYKCLNDHNYDRNACGTYFTNYQNCLQFWSKISKGRRRKGIKPHLPPPEDRDQILKEMNVETL